MSWVHGDQDLGMPFPMVSGVIRKGLRQVPGGSRHVEPKLLMHKLAGPEPSKNEHQALVLRPAFFITQIIGWGVSHGGMSMKRVEAM